MLSFLLGAASVIYIIVCILLIIIVLMQESRGGGLASAFGGSGLDLAFGAGIGRKMSRFTVGLATIFMILSIILAIVKPPANIVEGALPQASKQPIQAPEKPSAPQQEEQKKDTPPQQSFPSNK